jgi:prephenate dehydrogenase
MKTKQKKYNVCIIGTGLIGGSISYALQKANFTKKVIGVEKNKANAAKAVELKIVDEILPLSKAIPESDIIILAIPVHEIVLLLPKIFKMITHQTIMDVGSTKLHITNCLAGYSKSTQFVPTHPMWGTEYSGPQAAQKIAFKNKAVVICNKEQINKQSLAIVEHIYKILGMHIIYMNATEHDIHTAYISHVSHITSFALANTVLQKEKKEATIFELASGGFESTVRLAKSNSNMWIPIFLQNKKNILDVILELELQIAAFKKAIFYDDAQSLEKLIIQANKIKKILQ